MKSSYDDIRRKTIEENHKKMKALNLTQLSQSIYKYFSSSKSSSSLKCRSKFVQPGDLEISRKRLRSAATPITSPSTQTAITTPPIQNTPTTDVTKPPTPPATTKAPPPIQTTPTTHVTPPPTTITPPLNQNIEPSLSPETFPDHDISSPHFEDEEDDETEIDRVNSSEYWDVNVINETSHISKTRLRVQDLIRKTADGTRIIINRDSDGLHVGSAARLLAGYLGRLVKMFDDLPIMFDNWRKLLGDNKTTFYNSKIKEYFVVDEDGEDKRLILLSTAKWRDARCRLFSRYYKWDLTLEENLKKIPEGITKNDWAVFVQYRRKEKTQQTARTNARNRKKLKIPHTLGSKSLARKRHELELRDGRAYSRGEMYAISHTKVDGSFVNEDVFNNNQKLQAAIQDSPSENEAFEKVFRKQHPGYVRCMGLGVTPSRINRSTRSDYFEANEKMKKMEEEIVALKEKNSKIDELVEQIALLKQLDNAMKEEIALLMQMQNSSGRQNHLEMVDVLPSLAIKLKIMEHQEGLIRD